MDRLDTVIVGAGISGLNLGHSLQSKGNATLVIDQSMDLGFPPSGSCFIMNDIFVKYLSNYSDRIDGIYESLILEGEGYEEEFHLKEGERILSLDKEKLVRRMAADHSSLSGKLSIASSIKSIKREGDLLKIAYLKEGKNQEAYTRNVVYCNGYPVENTFKHMENCTKNVFPASYVRSLKTKQEAAQLRIQFNQNNFRIRCEYGKLEEQLYFNSKAEYGNAVSLNEYSVRSHSCFPESQEGVWPGGNILGFNGYIGTGIGFSLKFNEVILKAMESNWREGIDIMKDYFTNEISHNNFKELDPVEFILRKIPIRS